MHAALRKKLANTRFIFVTGGVFSSLGKGITAAALAALLKQHGVAIGKTTGTPKIKLLKLDPYLNVDPGTMSPIEHGEVFVTDDGGETDLDLGGYERFTGVNVKKGDNITSGRIYLTLLEKERRGDYLGKTVQVIPHVTNLIKDFISRGAEGHDYCICEIGGTVGDIEGLPFFEAIRQFANEVGRQKVLFLHVTFVPYVSAAKELKTKPTQHSVKELLAIGIQPDMLVCRCEKEIPPSELQKIALFCNVAPENVIAAPDVKFIYEVPIVYHQHGIDRQVLNHFGLEYHPPNLSTWENIIDKYNNPKGKVRIAVVGKYTKLKDAYKSLIEAFEHAGIHHQTKIQLVWINARSLETQDWEKLEGIDGIMVPGGFGGEGVEGKIAAIEYARTRNIPFFGICYGMQLAVIEAARNLVGLTDAASTEFTPETTNPVIGLLTEWQKEDSVEKRSQKSDLGGTMRLGSYPAKLAKGSQISSIYGGEETIYERHRHRYEVNSNYLPQLEKCGYKFSGMSPDGLLPETLERPDHPWFIGVQYHPELKSKPFEPHPLFCSFIEAAINYQNKQQA